MLVNLFSAEKKIFRDFRFSFLRESSFPRRALMFVSCVRKRRWRLGGRSAVKYRKAIFTYVAKRKSSSRTLYTCWNRVKNKNKKIVDFESLVLRKFRKITAISHPCIHIHKHIHTPHVQTPTPPLLPPPTHTHTNYTHTHKQKPHRQLHAHTHTHTHTHIQIYTHTHTQTHTHTSTHHKHNTHTHSHTHIHTHSHTHTHTHTNTHTHTQTHTLTQTHTYTHTHTHTQTQHTHTHTHKHTHTQTHTHTHTHTHLGQWQERRPTAGLHVDLKHGRHPVHFVSTLDVHGRSASPIWSTCFLCNTGTAGIGSMVSCVFFFVSLTVCTLLSSLLYSLFTIFFGLVCSLSSLV